MTRARVFDLLERSSRHERLGRLVDLFLIGLILLNIAAVMLETVDWIYQRHETGFMVFEWISVAIFTVEYLARVWSCVEDDALSGRSALGKRLRYMATPAAIVDLLAILPAYLAMFVSLDLRFLRALRLLRIFKLARYSTAMTLLLEVMREKSESFVAGFFILLVLLVLTASGAYLVEHRAQPEAFGSIPDAMWWAIVTLTTVGYGDVTPITPAGKVFGALVTVIGIGMAALPAGILASGLAEQIALKKDLLREEYQHALEDGVIDMYEQEQLEAKRKELGLSRDEAEDILRRLQQRRESGHPLHCPHCGGALDHRFH